MGSLFSRKKESRVTEQDKAILKLKTQRDQLKQCARKIEASLERERLLAKQLIANGRKDRAVLLLKKKRCEEQLLLNTENMLDKVEQMTDTLEYTQVEMQVMDGLQRGNVALKRMHQLLTVDDIERIMSDTHEAVELQREMDELLSGQLSDTDHEAVAAELEALVSTTPAAVVAANTDSDARLEQVLPVVPDTSLPDVSGDEEHALPTPLHKTEPVKQQASRVAMETA